MLALSRSPQSIPQYLQLLYLLARSFPRLVCTTTLSHPGNRSPRMPRTKAGSSPRISGGESQVPLTRLRELRKMRDGGPPSGTFFFIALLDIRLPIRLVMLATMNIISTNKARHHRTPKNPLWHMLKQVFLQTLLESPLWV